ncbi:DUF6873 family GME fold protein [uncultured Anaerococcus sp.]|uniref:DUF6873 family GME fold protein n=1 Tax=uncultured Anaerococcus sp. TaxID=293428 RepID=UPI002805DFC3|nr:hypothetical protein [uncultured Anaerococcus sp.]
MLVISYKASEDFKNFLKAKCFSFIETIANSNLDPRIGDHPDLSLFKIDEKTIVVDESVFSYYEEKLEGYELIKGESVGLNYPKDAIYNIVKFKDFYIHNDFTEKNIVNFFKENKIFHLKVNQGYTRCSIIPLGDLLITCDYGIYKALKNKVHIELVDNDKVILDGFDKGFLGGTCGLVGNQLIFTGDISKHKAFAKIEKICLDKNIEIIHPKTDLVDLGSIIEI